MTDEEILRVAIRLFGKNGYNMTSIRAIADECRISHGKIHKRWTTKKALLLDALDLIKVSAEESKMTNEKENSRTVIEQMFLLLRVFDIEEDDGMRLIFRLHTSPCPEVRKQFFEWSRGLNRAFLNDLKEHSESKNAAGIKSAKAESLYMFLSSFIAGWTMMQDSFRANLDVDPSDYQYRSEVMDLALASLLVVNPVKFNPVKFNPVKSLREP